MFDKDFYPTPDNVINKMLMEISVQGKIVLEPSAGKGNIVDMLQNRGVREVITFERQRELAEIVQRKSTFMGYDFLEAKAEDVSHIDYIIMNPPFSEVEDHILHAWEIAPEGCRIITLCPTAMLNNVHYNNKRKRIQSIIRNKNSDEGTKLGDCFSSSERKTNVEVTMYQLFKPVRSKNFDYEGFYMDMPEDLEQPEGLIKFDFVRSIVSRYVSAMKCFDEFREIADRMDTAIEPLGFDRGCKLKFNYDETARTKEDFSRKLQKAGWKKVFRELNMDKYVTSGVMQDINRFVGKQSHYPFTRENIYHMLQIIIGTQDNIMERALEEAFDKLTKHYDRNRYHVEGWKTNSHYLVNRKFIIPHIVEEGFSGDLRFCYNGYTDKVDDLNKALCYLTGRQNELGSIKGLTNRLPGREIQRATWYNWGFLKVKFYKKGTMHAKFKDKKVWERFNQRVAEIKGHPLPEKVDLAA
jgi:predicted RNA methylase